MSIPDLPGGWKWACANAPDEESFSRMFETAQEAAVHGQELYGGKPHVLVACKPCDLVEGLMLFTEDAMELEQGNPDLMCSWLPGSVWHDWWQITPDDAVKINGHLRSALRLILDMKGKLKPFYIADGPVVYLNRQGQVTDEEGWLK